MSQNWNLKLETDFYIGVDVTEPKKRTSKAIITLGYSNRTFEDLLGLLRQAGTQIVADVRSTPHSRQMPQFNQASLAERLPKLGITYHHLRELGGKNRLEWERSPNTGLPKVWQGFADFMLTEEFERSLRRLLALAAIGPVAILCAEADYLKCHRQFIADALTARGMKVAHLDAEGQIFQHTMTPRLEVRHGKITYPAVGEQMPLF